MTLPQGGRVSKERTQEIKKRGVGRRSICLKTVPLHELEALPSGGDFHLRHQARFANARFPAKQGNLPSVAFRPLKKQVQDGKLACAPDQFRADDGCIDVLDSSSNDHQRFLSHQTNGCETPHQYLDYPKTSRSRAFSTTSLVTVCRWLISKMRSICMSKR